MTRQLVPLSKAHRFVGVSRSTVYRWADRGELTVHEIQRTPSHAFIPYVWSDELTACEARMLRARHAPKPVRER